MRVVTVFAVVLVLLVLMVSSASAHIITQPPDPMGVPADSISLNHIVSDPPRPISVMDKGTIIGDIDIDPTFAPKRIVTIEDSEPDSKPPSKPGFVSNEVPTDQFSLNGGTTTIIVGT